MKIRKSFIVLGVGFVLLAASQANTAPLLYGDVDLDQAVDMLDASALADTLLGGPCRLANAAVSNDLSFNLVDLLLLAQYANGLRTPTEIDGLGAPFDLAVNAGDGQTGAPGQALPISLTTTHTQQTLAGLCIDYALFAQMMEILTDTTGGATLTLGAQTGTSINPVAFDGFGLSQPVTATLGPFGGTVIVRASREYARADGTVLGTRFVDFTLESIPPNCGDGLPDPDENCDDGAANGTTECGCNAYCNTPDAGMPCGAGVTEPTCDPDQCDGMGACTDAPPAADYGPCMENGGSLCLGGVCVPPPISFTAARKGTSLGYSEDYNNGLTEGPGGAIDVFTILPNDPAASAHGTDLVVFDIALWIPLVGGETVSCAIGGVPAFNNCGVGDISCLGWGPHPQLTGGGLDTVNQQLIPPGDPGIGTSVAPDEMDTGINTSIVCDINGGPVASQNIAVNMGFAGARDQVVAPGTTNVDVDFFSYCSNGATEFCGANYGGAPLGVERGIQLMDILFHYDPAVFDLGVTGETKPAGTGRDAANPYLQPPGGVCSPIDIFSCSQISPGLGRMTGYVIPCNGTIMLYGGSCRLSASAPPPTGTVTAVDVTVLNVDGTIAISDLSANQIRGIDLSTLAPLPSTNVTGYVIWD